MMKVRALPLIVCWAGAYAAAECVAVVLASVLPATTWPWVVLCAAVEGALLGAAQGWLLRGIGRRELILKWTVATIAGTLLARLIEFAADNSPLAGTMLGSPLLVQIVAGAALGAVVGASSASIQAVLLRGTIARSAWWIAICGAAWAITLPALLIIGAAAETVSGIPVWRAAVELLTLFGAIGAVTGAIEGAGLALLLRGPGAQPGLNDPLREGDRSERTRRYANGSVQATAGARRR